MVVSMAFLSRGVVLVAMFCWFYIGSPYDSSSLLQPSCLSSVAGVVNEEATSITRSVVWDGVYYLRIARCGYEYEQMHAFQPLLPLLMRWLSGSVFLPLVPLLGYSGTLVLSGYFVNNLAFILAAVYLHKLSELVLGDQHMAMVSTMFFCFNPASVFYSSIYSESLFALLSFVGMWYFVRGSKWLSAALFGLSSLARSNGVVHAGFFIFQALHIIAYAEMKRTVVLTVFQRILQVVCVMAPFLTFQAYGYYQICWKSSDRRPWCDATLPYLYGFVQSHYWNVGFLRYFQFKQLPNFLSASPALLLASSAIITYSRSQPRLFLSVGLVSLSEERPKVALLLDKHTARRSAQGTSKNRTRNSLTTKFFSPAVLCFVFELLFMTMVAFTVMHVQVSTRFLSSNPVIYWYAAHSSLKSKRTRYALQSIFLGYILVGTLLFVNFYPFT